MRRLRYSEVKYLSVDYTAVWFQKPSSSPLCLVAKDTGRVHTMTISQYLPWEKPLLWGRSDLTQDRQIVFFSLSPRERDSSSIMRKHGKRKRKFALDFLALILLTCWTLSLVWSRSGVFILWDSRQGWSQASSFTSERPFLWEHLLPVLGLVVQCWSTAGSGTGQNREFSTWIKLTSERQCTQSWTFVVRDFC